MESALRLSWAYSLRKEELITYLSEYDRDTSGTVEELRRRFAQFLGEEHSPKTLRNLLILQEKHEAATSSPRSKSPRTLPVVTLTTAEGVELSPTKVEHQMETLNLQNEQNTRFIGERCPRHNEEMTDQRRGAPSSGASLSPHGSVMKGIAEQIRKWNVSYDGEREPWEFIERLEELTTMHEIEQDLLPTVMPEVLVGRALIWFRNNNRNWKSWPGFKQDLLKFFLPRRYYEHLDDEIRKRRQKPRETFKNYTLHMQNLMRHSDLSEEQKLDRIFRNALTEYQWYIRRRDFLTLSDLLEMAEDMESIPPLPTQPREQHRRMHPEEIPEQQLPRINPRTACRRCGQDGHFAYNCQREPVIFCWVCGQRDLRSDQCCRRRSGNGDRTRMQRGVTSPGESQTQQ